MKTLLSSLLLTLLASCSSLDYDLSRVPFEVSAKPAKGEPFRIERKSILWAHGLFGQSNPNVEQLVTEQGTGHQGIAGFRVRVGGGFHDWLITHLTLTMVRMKTVVIEGTMVK